MTDDSIARAVEAFQEPDHGPDGRGLGIALIAVGVGLIVAGAAAFAWPLIVGWLA